jgi:hypothetical protein
MKKVEVGICYVNLLEDFLNILKDKDYQILRDYGFEWEVEEGFMEMWIDDLLDNFCKPLIEYDKDTEIILEG